MIVDIVYGFLGSGKTTFITKVLERWGGDKKTVVLVNEFGDVGIDGELLKNQGGNVLEMPSGCICCTHQADFRSQMLEICRTIRPERVIIEPTGVATIAQIQSIFQAQLFEEVIEKIHNVMIADATGFMGIYKANRHFMESQVKNAHLALLNKCDKVDKRKAMVTQGAISAINPDITVLMTEFGAVDWGEYQFALATAPDSGNQITTQSPTNIIQPTDLLGIHSLQTAGSHEHEKGQSRVYFNEEQDALGFESFGLEYREVFFDRKRLENLFQKLNVTGSDLGEIVRAKGIFRLDDGWMLMELASGEYSCQPLRVATGTKISLIGKGINRHLIQAAVDYCISKGRQ
ncbi:MAG: GTP-binding protein [Nitrospina sp.]|jgi:G3E family GTPase|nr:GTP-binding protein [Nitrospina sp.]